MRRRPSACTRPLPCHRAWVPNGAFVYFTPASSIAISPRCQHGLLDHGRFSSSAAPIHGATPEVYRAACVLVFVAFQPSARKAAVRSRQLPTNPRALLWQGKADEIRRVGLRPRPAASPAHGIRISQVCQQSQAVFHPSGASWRDTRTDSCRPSNAGDYCTWSIKVPSPGRRCLGACANKAGVRYTCTSSFAALPSTAKPAPHVSDEPGVTARWGRHGFRRDC